MQKFIPIFPLNLVAFPGEVINLHIFEPRYQQLIRECCEEEKMFGIPVVENNRMLDYGTEMELVKIQKEYPNGEMDVKVKGGTCNSNFGNSERSSRQII
jgi:Lon protease-like protein